MDELKDSPPLHPLIRKEQIIPDTDAEKVLFTALATLAAFHEKQANQPIGMFRLKTVPTLDVYVTADPDAQYAFMNWAVGYEQKRRAEKAVKEETNDREPLTGELEDRLNSALRELTSRLFPEEAMMLRNVLDLQIRYTRRNTAEECSSRVYPISLPAARHLDAVFKLAAVYPEDFKPPILP